jgi:hypothetical protein
MGLMMIVATETGSHYCNKNIVVFDGVYIYILFLLFYFKDNGMSSTKIILYIIKFSDSRISL